MPPASRGFFRLCSPITIFFRTNVSSASSQNSSLLHNAGKIFRRTEATAHKIKPIKYKSSPIEGRAPKRAPIDENPGQTRRERPIWRHYTRQDIFRWLGNMIIAAPIIAVAVTHTPFYIMPVTGGSMRPIFNSSTEADGEPETRDRMLVTVAGHYKDGDITRGEIVVFKTPHDPNKIAVKRVVALAGDRILPLQGYEGSEEEQNEGVVVGFNHMWVEGDVDDRNKSIDSNWYGPISQNLVIGRATAILSPWYRPRWITTEEQTWPAMEKRRVKYNDVEDAATHPDYLNTEKSWHDGKMVLFLEQIRNNRARVAKQAVIEIDRQGLISVYEQARAEIKKNDPQTIELANEIAKELESAFYRAKGHVEKPLFPELRQTVMKEMAQEKAARQSSSGQRVSKLQMPDLLAELEKEAAELEAATERAKSELQAFTK